MIVISKNKTHDNLENHIKHIFHYQIKTILQRKYVLIKYQILNTNSNLKQDK